MLLPLETRDLAAVAAMSATLSHATASAVAPEAVRVPLAGPIHFVATPAHATFSSIHSDAFRFFADPFRSGPVLATSDLKPGDILLSTERGGLSSAIRYATLSDYSHAALYLGNGKIIDATGTGVKVRNLSALAGPAERVGVIRVKSLSSRQADQIVRAATRLKGKWYNFAGLVTSNLDGLTYPVRKSFHAITGKRLTVSAASLTPGYYCSELVIHAFKAAGITIAPREGATPGGVLDFVMDDPSRFAILGKLPVG